MKALAPADSCRSRVVLVVSLMLLVVAAPSRAEETLRGYRASNVVVSAKLGPRAGVLLVRGGKIESFIADGGALPEGVDVVELGDVWLVPGFVDPLTAMDARTYARPGPARASISNETPRDARRALGLHGVDASEAIWRRLGRSGYTSFAFVPNGGTGLVAGQASVLRAASGGEKDAKDLVISESAYLLFGFAAGKPWYDAGLRYWKKTVDDEIKAREDKRKAEEEKKKAEEEAKKKAEEEAKKGGGEAKSGEAPKPEPPAAKPEETPKPPDPVAEAFEGKRTIFLRLGSPASIDHAFAFLDSIAWKPRFILVTRPQPPDVVERLAARRDRIDGVVLEPSVGTLWETSIWVNTAREFLRKGVPVAFVPLDDSLEGHRQVSFHLAEMVRSGLLESEALAAVTSVPARFLGLEGRIGVLEPDARADFVVWDGPPLSGAARLLSAWVSGVRVFSDDPSSGEISGEAIR